MFLRVPCRQPPGVDFHAIRTPQLQSHFLARREVKDALNRSDRQQVSVVVALWAQRAPRDLNGAAAERFVSGAVPSA